MAPETNPGSDRLEEGRSALAHGAWEAALDALLEAVRDTPDDGRAQELLGAAYTWLDRSDDAIQARQDAYALFREAGDDLSAARVAMDLAYDFLEVRGEFSVGNGWIQRGRRLLRGQPVSPEHAILSVWDAYLSLDEDPAAAEEHARAAVDAAGRAGAPDVEVLAVALQGYIAVHHGRLGEGMSLLDEAVAAAIGRDLPDPQWFYMACCRMIDACDEVRDYDRALEWCRRLREFSSRWRVRPFLIACRVKFTRALLWRGDWSQCEVELLRAIDEMGDSSSPLLRTTKARLAELRWRQGRSDEAVRLLEEAGSEPSAEPLRATIALEEGDAEGAAALLRAVLRHIPREASGTRVPVLELASRAFFALGDADQAAECADELEAIAKAVRTRALQAAARAARGRAAAARGDGPGAASALAEAAHLAEGAGSPYEASRIRLERCRVLASLDRLSEARREASRALVALEGLGAAADAARAREELVKLGEGAEPGAAGSPRRRKGAKGPLTRRQREVLDLVAQGLSDREVAERLFLSEHTVHRHVANILDRLGAGSRAAAVAHALRSELI